MARNRKLTPSYLEHKQSGRGRLVWTNHLGIRQQRLLPGPYGSDESLRAKARLELELATSPTGTGTTGSDLSVVELLAAYLTHAEQHYRGPDGKPTSKQCEVKIVVRAVRELYGQLPVAELGPSKLKALRQHWVAKQHVRTEINRRVGMVKRIIKWGVSEELIPPVIYQALASVSGLQRGRTEAKESEPVRPVSEEVVEATLRHLNRHVAGMVELQRLTGMRPGEACSIRRADIDTDGDVWRYRPRQHKTAYRGATRVIALGPKAQELLKQFFTPDINDYLFSPQRAVAEHNAARAANRKTPKYPSHVKHNEKRRTGPTGKRRPAEKYNRHSYTHAITRACHRAFPPPASLAPDEQRAWRNAHRWHANQLRHSYATKVRKAHGLEAAQVLLGHSRADVTQVYAERNEQLAAAVAAKIG